MSFRETTARPQDWDEGSLRYGMKSKGKKMKWRVEDLKAASIAWIVTMILMLMSIFYDVLREGRLSILSMVFFVSLVVYFSSLICFRKAR